MSNTRTEDVVYYELKEYEQALDYWQTAALQDEPNAKLRYRGLRNLVNELRNELAELQY